MTGTSAIRQGVIHLFVIAVGFVMMYPILWMISSSFKPANLIFTDKSLWPAAWEWGNYSKGWTSIPKAHFGTFFLNSFLLCIGSIIGNLVSCSLAAYAFARLRFRMKPFWFALMLVSIMLPHHATLVPQYILFHKLGWIGTYLPLLMPKLLATEAFFVFLIVQFIRGIPRDLDEAARIDGCGLIAIFLKIIVPLALPALITTALFTFIWTWDDFLSQMLYISDIDMYTVSLGLRLFLDSTSESAWGALFAMSVLSLVPSLVIFIFFQKYFVQGLASSSGIKG